MRPRMSLAVPFAVVLTMAVVGGRGGPVRAASLDRIDALVACQSALIEGGSAHLARRLAAFARCTRAVRRCDRDAATRTVCLAEAEARCLRRLARVGAADRALARTIVAACGTPLAAADLLDAAGLGFGALAARCAEDAAIDLVGVASFADCVTGLHQCGSEAVLASQEPRARERLRAAGVPPSVLDDLRCLPDFGGEGASGDDLEALARERCERTITIAGSAFATHHLRRLGRCVGKALRCRLLASDDAACTGAAVGCRMVATGLARAAARLDRIVARGCRAAGVDFGHLRAPTGANLDALTSRCAEIGVPVLDGLEDYGRCLVRRRVCAVEDLLAVEAPLASALLADLGVGVPSPFCAAPSAAATATPAPTPTGMPSPGPTATLLPGETPKASATPTATPTATRTPTPTATATPVCGDGEIDGDEECDGANLDDNGCDDLCEDEGGTLRCTASCTYDFSGCRGKPCEP